MTAFCLGFILGWGLRQVYDCWQSLDDDDWPGPMPQSAPKLELVEDLAWGVKGGDWPERN